MSTLYAVMAFVIGLIGTGFTIWAKGRKTGARDARTDDIVDGAKQADDARQKIEQAAQDELDRLDGPRP